MRPLLLRLVVLFLSALPLFAQQPGDDVQVLSRKLYAAVDAQKWDDAISVLLRLNELQPQTQGNAYNLACMHSRKGDLDHAVEWMDKAVQWGWGGGRGGIYAGPAAASAHMTQCAMTEQDGDLEALRKDPRYAKLVERMKALEKKAVEYAAAPALYVPEKLKDAPELGLLVVLHAQGGSKDSALAAWKPLADELGCALVVPAAPYPLREDTSKGWSWIDDPQNFQQPRATAEYQAPVHAAVEAFKKQKKLAAGKLWLAGEGQGATLALVTGMQNSTLYKGVAGLDPDVMPALIGGRAEVAKANALRLELRFDPEFWKQRANGQDPKPVIDALRQPFEGWALAGSVSVLADVKDAAGRQRALTDAARALARAAEAAGTTPASAPK